MNSNTLYGPIVVNLLGAPGAGKSTGAAYIFSKLKMAGVNAELITEYAKRKVWEESPHTLDDQLYVFGQQYHSMFVCQDKVDVIVTDSPLFLSAFYNKHELLGDSFNEVVINVFNSFDNMNYFINRVKPYNPKGRLQTEAESDMFAKKIKGLLQIKGIKFNEINGDVTYYDKVVDDVVQRLNTRFGLKIKSSNNLPVKEEEKAEFIGQIIDTFEDFLDEKGVVIPNSDRDNNPDLIPEESANIYGEDYGDIADDLRTIFKNWNIMED